MQNLNMKKEVNYKPLPGFEGLYEIGDDGSVLKLKGKIIISDYFEFRANQKGINCRARTIKIRYKGKYYNIPLAKTVATLFVENPNPEKYKLIDYKDGNQNNCRADNLIWVEHKFAYNNKPKLKFHINKDNTIRWI